jgi:hypothetical protein
LVGDNGAAPGTATVKGSSLARSQMITRHLEYQCRSLWDLCYSSKAHQLDFLSGSYQENANVAVLYLSSFLISLFLRCPSARPISGHVQRSVISLFLGVWSPVSVRPIPPPCDNEAAFNKLAHRTKARKAQGARQTVRSELFHCHWNLTA